MTLHVVRHVYAPYVNGCRWCGFNKGDAHSGRYVRGKGVHEYEPPTQTQREARLLARTLNMQIPRHLL